MRGEPTPKAGIRPRQRRHRTIAARRWPALVVWAVLVIWAGAAGAAQCVRPGGCGGDLPAGACGTGTQPIEEGEPCNQLNNCQKPEITSGPTVTVEATPPLSENQPPTFSVRISVEVKSPWNIWARENNPNGQLQAQWTEMPSNRPAICYSNMADTSEFWVVPGMSCAEMIAAREAGGANSTENGFHFVAATCGPPCNPEEDETCPTSECHKWVETDVPLLIPDALVAANCPKKVDPCGMGPGCGNDGSCGGYSPQHGGPGAELTYSAGGVGGYSPGALAWSVELGRYWSHSYARRLVTTGEPRRVWMITEGAIYREFWDLDGDGTFEKNSPSDFESTLRRVGDGFELTGLDGIVETYDANGRWLSSRDRDLNTTTATYSDDELTRVDFPDGRAERFEYHLNGRLAAIVEVGVDGSTRRWEYTWDDLDLIRIDRPDGTAWRFRYDDPDHPGYMTRAILVGTDRSERIEQAWSWDAFGNIAATWQGAETPATGVEAYHYRYTDPANPTESFITDPLGNQSTFNFERDPDSNKALLTHSTGSCPSCGSAPDTQQFREDPNNPLRVTRTVDARGVETRTAYDDHGQMISRTEAYGTALERTTTWEYDPDDPGLLLATEQPSTSGSGVRRTSWIYDTRGRPTAQTIEGIENGAPFSYTTETIYNGPGMVLGLNPPGNEYRDMTVFEYDPERGELILSSRIDPLVGITFFEHDAFNRQVRVTDPNGLVTETVYDALDRVLTVTQKGAATAEDLVTTYEYTPFGELHRTILPEGNVIEYGYDTRGRMVSIERKPDRETHGERSFYTLNDNGQRIREELQSWTGSGWQTEKWTGYVYTSGCNLDKVLHADGTVTEYGYGCDGSLEKEWDANHPSNNQESPATKEYEYDELDRLKSVTQPWGGEGGGTVVVRYEYDVQDHLVKVVDGNGTVTTYEYSDRDLLTMEISEVTGLTTYAYDERGQVIRETDARDVTVKREYDVLGRLRFVDYPEYDLDIMYDWDDKAVPFSKGRLTAIRRDGESVDYRYDRFGRMTQDGALTYGYDKNGNRTTIGYSAGITATYAYDYMDRQATLILQDGEQPPQPLVTSTSFKPFGPLTGLTLGNGLREIRTYTVRYFPMTIEVSDRVSWGYQTDAMGNITSITDHLDPNGSRFFAYQDYHYFLNSAGGPWGDLSWTYDKIGNRLSETRDGVITSHLYRPNAAGGSSPQVSAVSVEGEERSTRYYHDQAGNLTNVATPTLRARFRYDAAKRLSQIFKEKGGSPGSWIGLRYDGRSYLSRSILKIDLDSVEEDRETQFTYNTDGVLHEWHWRDHPIPSSQRATPPLTGVAYIFYFDGRPVAQLERRSVSSKSQQKEDSELKFITTDHLGAPIARSERSGDISWSGGFEPFGIDYSDAVSAGIYFRFRGQWSDPMWRAGRSDLGVIYNLNRWYIPTLGRYSRPDPLGTLLGLDLRHLYVYAFGNPLLFLDPSGLDAITDDPDMQDCFYCMLKAAGFGTSNFEKAAWITKISPDANYDCVTKGWVSQSGAATWPAGTPIPTGSIAFAHTHPTRYTDRPSQGPPSSNDEDAARRVQRPVYTIAPEGIWKFDPQSGTITQEANSDWTKVPKKRCKKRCKGLLQ